MTLDDALQRAIVGVFVNGFDARARAIRAEVAKSGGAETGAKAVMRLRAAADLEGCAASLAILLPADPPGTVTILPPAPPSPEGHR